MASASAFPTRGELIHVPVGAYLHIKLDRDGAAPIRSELFSSERMEQHAKSLAASQPVGGSKRKRKSLRRRLGDNSKRLTADFRTLAHAANSGKQLTSAGEWFLDNFYVVEEQIREVQKDLPADYYNELPKLSDGPLAGYPRVYGIAWALIAHTDGAFDVDRLERFLRAYQEVEPLKIGELWAVAITLRITLVENLRRLAEIVVARLADGERAEAIAKRILSPSATGEAAVSLDAILGPATVSATLITRLEQRLRNQDAAADAAIRQINSALQGLGTSSDALIQEEYQLQGADDISVRNVINAMRLVSSLNWADLVENVGLVDRALREEPVFATMDFPTRDRYRRAVEKFARRSPLDEVSVAAAAVEQARAAPGVMPREKDLGYYLIGGGAEAFGRKIRYSPSLSQHFWMGVGATGLTGYLAFIAVGLASLVALLLVCEFAMGIAGGALAILGGLAILPAFDLAIAFVNRMVTDRWGPEIAAGAVLERGRAGFPAHLAGRSGIADR